jgi:polyisoprenoid-binding protein YceI
MPLSSLTQRSVRRMAALGVIIALSLSGCSSLTNAVIKPDVETAAESVPAGDYKLDQKHASLLFKINHLGFSTYVGRFERFDAQLDGSPDSVPTAQVTATVDMTSLNVANPEFAQELMGPDWFDAERFPQASFKTFGLKVVGENTADISGELTLKGVTRFVLIRAKLNGSAYDVLRGADVVGFSATLPISRAEFGIDKYKGLLADEVLIEIEAEFVRTKRE